MILNSEKVPEPRERRDKATLSVPRPKRGPIPYEASGRPPFRVETCDKKNSVIICDIEVKLSPYFGNRPI